MQQYTLRVYAIIFNKAQEVLLLHETYKKVNFTKFPGGGMEPNEGTLDCLKRELHEELGLNHLDFEHFYTTDFYVASAFNDAIQVLSIYYRVKQTVELSDFNFNTKDKKLLDFSFVPLNNLDHHHVTFPIDQKVVTLLKNILNE